MIDVLSYKCYWHDMWNKRKLCRLMQDYIYLQCSEGGSGPFLSCHSKYVFFFFFVHHQLYDIGFLLVMWFELDRKDGKKIFRIETTYTNLDVCWRARRYSDLFIRIIEEVGLAVKIY